ncbi:MAG: CBS domain-containing protein [Acidimicrobiales bacterium]
MSPRAAWRLERLGFDVYDYAAGKVDWLAAGLLTVQAHPLPRRALDQADRDPPTCSPDTPVEDLDTPSALVVNEARVVLGRVRADGHPPSGRAEDVMEPGPTTVRAHEPLDPLLARMQQRNAREIVVTTSEGRLLGVLRSTA